MSSEVGITTPTVIQTLQEVRMKTRILFLLSLYLVITLTLTAFPQLSVADIGSGDPPTNDSIPRHDNSMFNKPDKSGWNSRYRLLDYTTNNYNNRDLNYTWGGV